MGETNMAEKKILLQLQHLNKYFGKQHILKDVDLTSDLPGPGNPLCSGVSTTWKNRKAGPMLSTRSPLMRLM